MTQMHTHTSQPESTQARRLKGMNTTWMHLRTPSDIIAVSVFDIISGTRTKKPNIHTHTHETGTLKWAL